MNVFCDQKFPACMPGNTCFQVSPYPDRDWKFDCAAINSTLMEGPINIVKGNVLFLHGNDGPMSKGMWSWTMQSLAKKGYNTFAFDQRGYSPEASPYTSDDYNYDLLADDIFAMADAYFGKDSKFHLVAHDQGARLGWHAIALGTAARERFLSYIPVAIAHADAFSDALYGSNPDKEQQESFMYLWDFTLPGNNTLAYENNIWNVICKQAHYYDTPEACQPSIWWYIGAVESGNLAMQPFGSFGAIGKQIGIPEDYVKEHSIYPFEGRPQTKKVGNVSEFPVFYMCGVGDYADKCSDRLRDDTAKYVKDFHYYRSNNCGHNLVTDECSEYQTVIANIVDFIENIV
jgi:pimeloyl-ACP methyl ester carboxylesterase